MDHLLQLALKKESIHFYNNDFILRHLPNILTLGNLLVGSIGIILVFKGMPELGASMIWVAALLDFFDGFAARLLKVHSDLGKQLDSLADLVSFGLLPSILVYYLLDQHFPQSTLPFIGLAIVIFSALRLAKFNIDTRQSEEFIGLPTPANALFFSVLPWFNDYNITFAENFTNPYAVIVLTVIFSLMLVAPVRLFSLKIKQFSWSAGKYQFILIILSLVLIFWMQLVAIPLIIFLYIILSLVRHLTIKG